MENILITPEEILDKQPIVEDSYSCAFEHSSVILAMKEYARLMCEKQKRVCAENAEAWVQSKNYEDFAIIKKESILNCPNVVE